MKVLVATEKPFAKAAVEGIRKIVEGAGNELALLEKYADTKELLAAVETADALIVRSDKVTCDVIQAAKQLKIVVRAGAGYDNLDLPSCTSRDIVAMNTPGQNSNAVAELAIGMMVFMSRNMFQPGTGSELLGKNLGIHAYGNVGKLVAKHAQGFGMQVYAFDPFVSAESMEKDGVNVCSSVEALYEKSDFLSLHIPATAETKNSINYALLSRMPKGACLVNTARKEVIHETDLARLLEDRPDLKYISDIAPSNDAELKIKFPKQYFSTAKKMGAETAEANINAGLAAANQIVAFFNEGCIKFKVN